MAIDASVFDFNNGAHFEYLKTAYVLLIGAYQQQIKSSYDPEMQNENDIRNDLVKTAKNIKDTDLAISWITEFPDLENKSRTDIALITPYNLGKEEEYIIIECKIVGEDKYIDNKKSFERENPTNGIMSFISGKYAQNMPLAGMIGFVKEGNIQSKIKNIRKRLTEHGDIKTIQNLIKYSIKENFKYSYQSIHERYNGVMGIEIYHLFFDYT